MHYAAIKAIDVANGPGCRVSLFVSGCTHRCKGCFNPESWNFAYGKPFDADAAAEILEKLAPDYIRGLTLLGGEPLHPENRGAVLALIKEVRRAYPQKTIWCYTGYRLEEELLPQAQDDPVLAKILENLDVLVDGRFTEEKKDLGLRFRGSSNQRVLDMPATRRAGAAKTLYP